MWPPRSASTSTELPSSSGPGCSSATTSCCVPGGSFRSPPHASATLPQVIGSMAPAPLHSNRELLHLLGG